MIIIQGGHKAEGEALDGDVSISEFLLFFKECQLTNLGYSYIKAIDVFIDCNKAEVPLLI